MSFNASTAGAPAGSAAPALVLVGRLFVSILFILAGYAKLTGIAGTAGWFASIGLPVPTVTAVVVGLIELIGGLAILAGWQTRIAAAVVALFTLGATVVAHLDFSDQTQILMLQKNLAIAGGLLFLAVYGPGAYSLDRRGS
jgi:putative oxidoreductase